MSLVRRILELLERDARHTSQQIAAMLGEDENRVAAEIARLEKDKIILGRTTIINWEKAGDDGVTAMVEVKVTPEREVGFDAIANRICRFPEVRAVYLMSGSYDLAVVVHGKDLKDISTFISQKLATMDQVQSTTTHFVLKRYKQDGFIFDDKEMDRRLVVSP
ncbi:MAG: Lrp/AsnC family transcriptional regulator [Syntrophomonadaceae bacterium]|nr:Lrp/AsnC family transcriptional regulator [Syntrophomonadaceae bacterium]